MIVYYGTQYLTQGAISVPTFTHKHRTHDMSHSQPIKQTTTPPIHDKSRGSRAAKQYREQNNKIKSERERPDSWEELKLKEASLQ